MPYLHALDMTLLPVCWSFARFHKGYTHSPYICLAIFDWTTPLSLCQHLRSDSVFLHLLHSFLAIFCLQYDLYRDMFLVRLEPALSHLFYLELSLHKPALNQLLSHCHSILAYKANVHSLYIPPAFYYPYWVSLLSVWGEGTSSSWLACTLSTNSWQCFSVHLNLFPSFCIFSWLNFMEQLWAIKKGMPSMASSLMQLTTKTSLVLTSLTQSGSLAML